MIYSKKKINFVASASLLFLLLITIVVPTQQSCYYDNEEDLYPNTTCDTTDMRYSVEIKKIMDDKCLSCHTGTGGTAGIAMESYSLLKGFATGGQLVNRTNDASNPMPPITNGGLLSECDRQKIQSWVNAGAKNN